MIKCCNYKIAPEFNIIIETFTGDIQFDLLKKHTKRIVSDSDYNPRYNTICDFRSICPESFCKNDRYCSVVKEKNIDSFIEYCLGNESFVSKRKTALLTCTPKQALFSYLMKEKTKHLPISVEVFSTLDAALFWLNNTNHLDAIDHLINELKNNKAAKTITK